MLLYTIAQKPICKTKSIVTNVNMLTVKGSFYAAFGAKIGILELRIGYLIQFSVLEFKFPIWDPNFFLEWTSSACESSHTLFKKQ